MLTNAVRNLCQPRVLPHSCALVGFVAKQSIPSISYIPKVRFHSHKVKIVKTLNLRLGLAVWLWLGCKCNIN